MIFLYSFIISSKLGGGHRWIFFRLLGFDCDDQSCLHIFLRSWDKCYFVYSLASKVNCHKTSQYGNNRTNIWIEIQKLKTLKKLNTWWFQAISVFETSLYFYKIVSLENDISHWNKTKQTICISRKYSWFTKNSRNNIDSVNDNATRE